MTSSPTLFRDELWDNFEAVSGKVVKDGQATMRTISQFLQEHSGCLLELSRSLARVSSEPRVAEGGSLSAAVVAVLSHTAAFSRAFSEAHSQTVGTALRPLEAAREEIKRDAARAAAEGGKIWREMGDLEVAVGRGRARAHRLGAEADAAQRYTDEVEAISGLSDFEAQKAARDAQAARREFERADAEYRQAVDATRAFRARHGRKLGEVLGELQRLEAEKTEAVKAHLLAFLEVQGRALQAVQRSLEATVDLVRAVDPAADQALFVSEVKTGKPFNPVIEYVPYVLLQRRASLPPVPAAAPAAAATASATSPRTPRGSRDAAGYAAALAHTKEKKQRLVQTVREKAIEEGIDPDTGEQLFKPKTGRPPASKREGPVSDALFEGARRTEEARRQAEERAAEERAALSDQPKVLKASQRILDAKLRARLAEIFDALDADNDGEVDVETAADLGPRVEPEVAREILPIIKSFPSRTIQRQTFIKTAFERLQSTKRAHLFVSSNKGSFL